MFLSHCRSFDLLFLCLLLFLSFIWWNICCVPDIFVFLWVVPGKLLQYLWVVSSQSPTKSAGSQTMVVGRKNAIIIKRSCLKRLFGLFVVVVAV